MASRWSVALGLSLVAGGLAAGCRVEEAPPQQVQHGPTRLRLLPVGIERTAGDGERIVHVRIAADPGTRERGLMGVAELPPDTGMLFVYPASAHRSFWMKNCPVALDAAFLDETGTVLNILTMAPGEGLPEGSLPRYRSAGPAMYVLEMEAGWFTAAGTGAGDRMDLAGALLGVRAR